MALRTVAGVVVVVALAGLVAVALRAWRRARTGGKPWSVGDTTGVAGLIILLATSGFGLVSQLPADERRPPTSQDLYTLDGFNPGRSPTRRDAIGFVALGDDPSIVQAELGAPADTSDDPYYTDARRTVWRLPDGAILTASHLIGGPYTIFSLMARVRELGQTRFAMNSGLVLGASPLKDFLRAWGRPAQFNTAVGGDFVVSYETCVRGAVVWIKLDQQSRRRRAYDRSLDDVVVTSALTFFPDDRPARC